MLKDIEMLEIEMVILKVITEAMEIAEKECLEQGVDYGSLFKRVRQPIMYNQYKEAA